MTIGQPNPNAAEEEKVLVDNYNEKTVEGLWKLQTAVETLADSKHEILAANAARTFRDLRIMIWTTFGFGLGLVLFSIAFFALGKGTLSVLGLGTLGVADWVALFFYKPMDRLQAADRDYLQQIIAVRGWAISINLEMRAMRIDDRKTVLDASKNVRTATWSCAHSLQDFVSPPQTAEAGASQQTPAAKKDTTPAAPADKKPVVGS